jgi:hypothetical protein
MGTWAGRRPGRCNAGQAGVIRGVGVVGGSGRQRYVALLIDTSTGEIEAHGPVDEPNAVVLAAELHAALAADAELREVGVLILPLRPPATRLVAPPEAPAAG